MQRLEIMFFYVIVDFFLVKMDIAHLIWLATMKLVPVKRHFAHTKQKIIDSKNLLLISMVLCVIYIKLQTRNTSMITSSHFIVGCFANIYIFANIRVDLNVFVLTTYECIFLYNNNSFDSIFLWLKTHKGKLS